MITAVLFSLFLEFFVFVYSFLPVATFPAGLTDVLDAIGPTLSLLSLILPVLDFMNMAIVVLTIESVITVYKIGNLLYNKIRGSGA